MNLYDYMKDDILIDMRKLDMKTLVTFLTFLMLITSISHSYAQNDEYSAKMADPDATVIEPESEEDKYVRGTVSNLSKLYWKLGALDTSNKVAVDNFLRINECDIYSSFYTDDFQWSEVRAAATKMIKEEIESFPNKFQFTFPIDLGRYDMKRQGFPLVSGTRIRDLRRVQITGNSMSSKVCGESGVIPFYPKNIIMILNRPLTFDFLQLDEHVAQAFIVRRKYDEADMNARDSQLNYNRIAFIQLRVSISHFQGIQSAGGATNEELAVVYGKIDTINVFEDRAHTRLLKNIPLVKRKRVMVTDKKESSDSEEQSILETAE